MSNEIDTVDQKTKSQKDESSDPVSSESNESDYIEEHTSRYKMNIVASPVVKQLDDPVFKFIESNDNKIHPFMLEGVVEERRRMSSVMPSREMILNIVSAASREDDKVSSANFDENYMMFGGEHYNKVRESA